MAVGALHIFGHPRVEMSRTVTGCTIFEQSLFELEQRVPGSFTSPTGVKLGCKGKWGVGLVTAGVLSATHNTVYGEAAGAGRFSFC